MMFLMKLDVTLIGNSSPKHPQSVIFLSGFRMKKRLRIVKNEVNTINIVTAVLRKMNESIHNPKVVSMAHNITAMGSSSISNN